MSSAERHWCATALAGGLVLSAFFFHVAGLLAELERGALPVTWVALGVVSAGLPPAVLLRVRRDRKTALVCVGYVVWVVPLALVLLLG